MCALDQSPISDRLAGVKEIYNWKLFLSILCLFIPQLDRKSLSLMLFWVFNNKQFIILTPTGKLVHDESYGFTPTI